MHGASLLLACSSWISGRAPCQCHVQCASNVHSSLGLTPQVKHCCIGATFRLRIIVSLVRLHIHQMRQKHSTIACAVQQISPDEYCSYVSLQEEAKDRVSRDIAEMMKKAKEAVEGTPEGAKPSADAATAKLAESLDAATASPLSPEQEAAEVSCLNPNTHTQPPVSANA